MCDKDDPGVFPPWDTILYICANCPRRKEFLRLQTEHEADVIAARITLEMVGSSPKKGQGVLTLEG